MSRPGAVMLRAMAPAKVNLCLFLGPMRGDGRHELVTVFESISLGDVLTLRVADRDQVVCPGVPGPNLVEQALRALRARGWPGPAVRIEIAKRIPVAAGLGGGSADAAAALRLADHLARMAPAQLLEVAIELGADVPSQLTPGISLGTGAGEVVEALAPVAEHAFVIVPSEQSLSTPAVYAEGDRLGLPRPSLAGVAERVRAALPRVEVVNELAPAALSLAPGIAAGLDALRGAGADDVLVCGSGPTVAGVWWGEDAGERASAAAAALASRFPDCVVARPVLPAQWKVT